MHQLPKGVVFDNPKLIHFNFQGIVPVADPAIVGFSPLLRMHDCWMPQYSLKH